MAGRKDDYLKEWFLLLREDMSAGIEILTPATAFAAGVISLTVDSFEKGGWTHTIEA